MRLTLPAVIAASLLLLTGCTSAAETADETAGNETAPASTATATPTQAAADQPALAEADAAAQCVDAWHPGVGSDFQENFEKTYGADHYLASSVAGEWRITLRPKISREAEWNLYCASGGSEVVSLSNGYDDWPPTDETADHVLTRSQALEQCRTATRDYRMGFYAEAFEELYPNELASVDLRDGEWAVTLAPSDTNRASETLSCTSNGAVFTFDQLAS